MDRIEIHLLQAPEGTEEIGKFPVRAYDRDYPVYGAAKITRDDAKEAAPLWTYTLKAAKFQAMSHDSPYDIRMYAGKEFRIETSICWSCRNFYIQAYPGEFIWYGFDAGLKTAADLPELFDSKLPYSKRKREIGVEGD